MAQGQVPDKNVKIAAFAKGELDELVESLSTTRPDLKVGDGAIMSALILAARRVPLEAIAAAQTTYWNELDERAAHFAVCSFIIHFGR